MPRPGDTVHLSPLYDKGRVISTLSEVVGLLLVRLPGDARVGSSWEHQHAESRSLGASTKRVIALEKSGIPSCIRCFVS